MLKKDDIRYIAHLSRIYLQEKEVEGLIKDLESILHYIEKLKKLNVKDIEPTSHVLPLKNVFRKDTPKPSLTQKEAIKISVANARGSFKVPQVIE